MRKWLAGRLIRLAHRINPPDVTEQRDRSAAEAVVRMYSETGAGCDQGWHITPAGGGSCACGARSTRFYRSPDA